MTAQQLFQSDEFQALLRHEYEDAFHQRMPSENVAVKAMDFVVNSRGNNLSEGSFRGAVETTEGVAPGEARALGETTGTFRLFLPHGGDTGTAEHILNGATLEVAIESPSTFSRKN